MFVNESEAIERLNSKDNLVNKLKSSSVSEVESEVIVEEEIQESNIEIRDLHPGRTGSKLNPMMRTLLVETAILGGSQTRAAQAFGVTQPNVSALISKGKDIDRDRVKDSVSSAHSKALDVMLSSIELIQNKLPDVKKATDLSKIAADMGRVIEKTTPKESATTNVRVVVMAPMMREERDYEEITTT